MSASTSNQTPNMASAGTSTSNQTPNMASAGTDAGNKNKAVKDKAPSSEPKNEEKPESAKAAGAESRKKNKAAKEKAPTSELKDEEKSESAKALGNKGKHGTAQPNAAVGNTSEDFHPSAGSADDDDDSDDDLEPTASELKERQRLLESGAKNAEINLNNQVMEMNETMKEKWREVVKVLPQVWDYDLDDPGYMEKIQHLVSPWIVLEATIKQGNLNQKQDPSKNLIPLSRVLFYIKMIAQKVQASEDGSKSIEERIESVKKARVVIADGSNWIKTLGLTEAQFCPPAVATRIEACIALQSRFEAVEEQKRKVREAMQDTQKNFSKDVTAIQSPKSTDLIGNSASTLSAVSGISTISTPATTTSSPPALVSITTTSSPPAIVPGAGLQNSMISSLSEDRTEQGYIETVIKAGKVNTRGSKEEKSASTYRVILNIGTKEYPIYVIRPGSKFGIGQGQLLADKFAPERIPAETLKDVRRPDINAITGYVIVPASDKRDVKPITYLCVKFSPEAMREKRLPPQQFVARSHVMRWMGPDAVDEAMNSLNFTSKANFLNILTQLRAGWYPDPDQYGSRRQWTIDDLQAEPWLKRYLQNRIGQDSYDQLQVSEILGGKINAQHRMKQFMKQILQSNDADSFQQQWKQIKTRLAEELTIYAIASGETGLKDGPSKQGQGMITRSASRAALEDKPHWTDEYDNILSGEQGISSAKARIDDEKLEAQMHSMLEVLK